MNSHKIQVWYGGPGLWYARCLDCRWDTDRQEYSKKWNGRYLGRDTWDAALALGIAHQQNENGRGELE